MQHTRINMTLSSASCGLMELSRISEVDDAIYQVACRLYHPSRGDPVAALIVSDIATNENSTKNFVNLFKKMGFCQNSVTSTPVENPKTGNFIFVSVLNIEHKTFKKWYSEERVRRLSKAGT